MQYRFFDFHRIFIGDAPWPFLLEIVFRTAIMYGYTIFLLRFLGKRGMGQLSSLEVAIIICFGTAVGDPMMQPDTPIIYGIIAITTIAIIQIGMERVINKHKKLEEIMEGKAECLVDDGIIMLDALKKNNLSHEDLFRSLRNNEVEQLGEVKKAYFETSGQISVIFHSPKKIKAGLSVMPVEETPDHCIYEVPEQVPKDGVYCCKNCGNRMIYSSGSNLEFCNKCTCESWVDAEL